MPRKRPGKLTIETTSLYPRWTCFVTDGKGWANGGFWRGFTSHEAMYAWLRKNGYING